MFSKNDRVQFKDELVKERKLPPYVMKVLDAYNMCGSNAYDIEDTVTGEKYVAIPEKMLKLVEKSEPEKISKKQKRRFQIRKNMFVGMWFIGCPIVLLVFLFTQSYLVFISLLIPIAVGIFGADD